MNCGCSTSRRKFCLSTKAAEFNYSMRDSPCRERVDSKVSRCRPTLSKILKENNSIKDIHLSNHNSDGTISWNGFDIDIDLLRVNIAISISLRIAC